MPPPAPFGIKPPVGKPRDVAPGWSDEVDKHFPYKNHVECYGRWLMQKVTHIPIRHYYKESNSTSASTCQSEQDAWAKTVLFTTNQVHPFSFSRGYEEVIEVKAVPGAWKEEHSFWFLSVTEEREWDLYTLKTRATLAGIVEHLLKPGCHIEQLCDHRPLREWPIDYGRLDQFLACRDHYFENFGRLGEKLLP
ncbi:hypothetical protein M407DRAFT_33888 [Tulasnella calospora MUT 4182]|uniref:Uncharacterized protein n=1 Tax=Tulasnella calospora MUT 4182 TaxID=1051891 RepID=A0A0C3Q286_9AGAM|nr:hypothetical protein M407DRAFT_33888 [Tulasnella calospora MUT 4182]